MSKDLSELDKLIKESEAAIQRLDDVQKARHNTPLLERMRRHLHKNSPHLLNVLMAGTVLAVVLGRLDQKQKHQVRSECCTDREQALGLGPGSGGSAGGTRQVPGLRFESASSF